MVEDCRTFIARYDYGNHKKLARHNVSIPETDLEKANRLRQLMFKFLVPYYTKN